MGAALLAACSTTRSLKDGEYLLRRNSVKVDRKDFDASQLGSYIVQKPNSYLLGVNPMLSVYNWGGDGETGIGRFLQQFGTAPVVYDPASVEESVQRLQNHLTYIGYFGSQVESDVQVKKRKVYVTYYVALGKQYKISSIDYDIPQYGTFAADFENDLKNSTVHKGDVLSENALDKEAARSAQYFRNLGYYGFNKSFFSFEADTLKRDGYAALRYSIRDYALGDVAETAQEHRKFTLGNVTISHPEDLKLRPRMLENLNTLRPGQLYDEREINTTYSRFSSVSMLSGVNVNMTQVSDDKVDADIALASSGLQGFKTNLEASINSTGLVGISPQLSYSHKNLFHGGELLNLGLKGNFQFQPGTNVRSTDISLSTTLRFPQFIGLPNRIFRGPNLPHTDISASFSYQNRPEFRRTNISAAFTYHGRWGSRFFYQLTPLRMNIARVFDINETFLESIFDNRYLSTLYSDNFDMGVSGMLYYTTDASAIPAKPYHYARLSVDLSGNVLSLLNPILPMDQYGDQHLIWSTPYAQYVRGELQLGRTMRFGNSLKHALALHFLAGAAYAYGNAYTAPLDRLFYAGGSSSMRGWQARSLGPGNDALTREIFLIPSQFGDLKFEANIEYRFPLVSKLEGAVFVDAGNVWDIIGFEDAVFSVPKLWESIGLDWGVGLRINLDFILVRVDTGFRLHDPGYPKEERWIGPDKWFKNNYAIHFGVGYPF